MSCRASPRQVLHVHGPMAILGVGVVIALWDAADWRSWGLLLGLLAIGIVGALRPVVFGPMLLDTHTPAVVSAIALAGPGPAAVIGVVSCIAGDVYRRPPHYLFLNASATLLWIAVAGLALEIAFDLGLISEGDPSVAVGVFCAGLLGVVVNFVCMLPSTALEGTTPREALLTNLWPILPFDVLGVFVGASAVALYELVGLVAILALAFCVAILRWVLEIIGRGDRREWDVLRLSEELTSVTQQERRKLAAALHDDALQSLASARQDLGEALSGDDASARRAQQGVARAIRSLRNLMVSLDTDEEGAPDVHAVAASIEADSGLTITCAVDPDGIGSDAIVVACVAELLRNVQKHAEAHCAWVTVRRSSDGTVIEVVDDGRGDAVDLHGAVAAGRLGLALVARRAQARGGTLTLEPRPTGGLKARVTLGT